MNAQHTPGPWAIKAYSDTILISHYIGMGSNEVVARAEPARRPAIREANARLISAAPELLAACRWMQDFIEAVNEDRVTQDQRDLYTSMMKLAGDAIAKAGGA